MNVKEELFERIKALLHSQLFGVLATRGEQYPYSSLVSFAASEGACKIFFATIRETRKYRNLSSFPEVSLLINNQTNQAADFVEAHALTVLGRAREVSPEWLAEARGLYLNRHPYLKEFVEAPNCAMVMVEVAKYISVTNFQSVMEYTMQ